jgi:hypothetical protein
LNVTVQEYIDAVHPPFCTFDVLEFALEFAFRAFFIGKDLDENIIVDEAANTESGIAFEPSGKVTGQGNSCNSRLVGTSQTCSVLHQDKARQGQCKSNEPCEALWLGWFP